MEVVAIMVVVLGVKKTGGTSSGTNTRKKGVVRVRKNACDGCKYYHPWYGQKDKTGKPIQSRHWCIERNGFLKRFPKKCDKRKGLCE